MSFDVYNTLIQVIIIAARQILLLKPRWYPTSYPATYPTVRYPTVSLYGNLRCKRFASLTKNGRGCHSIVCKTNTTTASIYERSCMSPEFGQCYSSVLGSNLGCRTKYGSAPLDAVQLPNSYDTGPSWIRHVVADAQESMLECLNVSHLSWCII